MSGIASGPLEVNPEKIHAEDQDTIRSDVEYEFLGGTPSDFRNFFKINFLTGVIRQSDPVSRVSAKEYNISVRATEVSRNRLSADTFVIIRVLAEDLSPPVLSVSSPIGYVDENSNIGTPVLDANGNNITFKLADADIVRILSKGGDHSVSKGPSINYVISKLGIFDPLTPLCCLFTK